MTSQNSGLLGLPARMARLKTAPKLSSSMSNFEEYMMQFKGTKSTDSPPSFTSMFLFYAYKYLLVFPLALYNIVFIPMQMGFTITFDGWYLFFEIMTILVYSADIYFIGRHFLQLQQSRRELAAGGSMEGRPSNAHDRDEIETKLSSARLDLATSVVSMLPCSLIF